MVIEKFQKTCSKTKYFERKKMSEIYWEKVRVGLFPIQINYFDKLFKTIYEFL